MDSFTDYYEVLGVATNASPTDIKAAFKKLALQYHPDVYKGADAHERMRIILQAYQTLSDPGERRTYDARHSEHVLGAPAQYVRPTAARVRTATKSAVSPSARRDRHRHYDFPDIRQGESVQVDLVDVTYDLSPLEANTLLHQGMLRGMMRDPQRNELRPNAPYELFCHRCHRHWAPPSVGTRSPGSRTMEQVCPSCKADDWAEYLLLRCIHCCAVFESEQIRYEVGSYNYGDGTLCPPYELFPLCPYCGASGWCPAENERVSILRAEAAKRAARMRLLWISVAVVALVAVGLMLTIVR